jgi:hypothetical protein
MPSSYLHLQYPVLLYETHHQYPELLQHHVTSTKQRLGYQNTPDIIHTSVHSLWAAMRYVQV